MNGVALVTGGAGFVGANVVRRLLRDGLEVHVVHHRDEPPWRLADIHLERHRCSITDADAIAAVVSSVRPDWVFHLAAHGAYSDQTGSERITGVNLLGTLNLLDAVVHAGGCAGFVHTGSSSEYGIKDHAPSEDEVVAPASVYAITKCAATHAVSHWARAQQLPAATVRLYSVYGPWEEPARLMPRLVAAARANRWPPLAAPSVAHDFVWVDDAVDAIVRAAGASRERPGAVWNVGSGVQTTLEQLVAVARDLFGVDEEPRWQSMPDRVWDTHRWIADPSRAHDELGWRSVTDLRDGLRQFAVWMAAEPQRARYAI